MAIRRLFGTATVDLGVFWEDKVNERGWRIQYNHTLDVASPLKPFRLLDPRGNLWASADMLPEMAKALPELVAEFSQKEPLFDSDDVKRFVKEVAKLAATSVTGKMAAK